jgi:parallel beta-helix repeat protein
VANGSYLGFELNGVSGSPGSPIVITDPGHDAVIETNGSCCNWSTQGEVDNLYFNQVSWFVVDGLRSYDIESTVPTANLWVSQCNHLVLSNLTFENGTYWNFTQGWANKASLFVDLSSNITVEYDNISGAAASHGIYFNNDGVPLSYGDTIRNNILDDNNWSGVQFVYATNSTVEDNVIAGNGAGGAAGISLREIVDSDIVNNLVYDEMGAGIAITEDPYSAGGTLTSGDLFAYNTIVAASNGRSALLVGSGSTGTRSTVRDNILYAANNGSWASIDYQDLPGVDDLVSDHNVVQNVQDPNGTYTLSQWKGLGHENGSIAATPAQLFVNSGLDDYNLSATSPAIKAGEAMPAVNRDIVGDPRPVIGASDIGCYEVTPPVFTAFASASPTSGVFPLDVSFTGSAAAGAVPYSYTWNYGDGSSTSSAQDPSHTYNSTGTFQVRLTALDSNGSVARAYLNISVRAPPPLTSYPAISPTTPSVGQTVSFMGAATGGREPYVAWAWRFGDGASASTRNASHSYSAPGNYTVTLNVTDSASTTASASVRITASTVFQVLLSISTNTSSIPLGTTFILTALTTGGSPPYTFSWRGLPTGCASADKSVLSCKPTAQGHTNVTVTAVDGAGHSGTSLPVAVYVYPGMPPVVVSLTLSRTSFSLGETTNMTAHPSGGTGNFTSFVWSGLPFGCSSADRTSLICKPTVDGHYNVTVTVVDSEGHAGDSSPVEVDIWTATPSASSCTGPLCAIGISGSMGWTLLVLIVVVIIVVLALVAARLRGRVFPPEQPPEPAKPDEESYVESYYPDAPWDQGEPPQV